MRPTFSRRPASATGSETAADRLDGLRWAHVDVRRAAHGAAELEGRARAAFRARADEWAVRSHQRAAAAQDAGRLATRSSRGRRDRRRGHPPRHDAREARELKPVHPEGTTTAGNAPGVNDGASCVIVTSRSSPSGAVWRSSPRSCRRRTSRTTSLPRAPARAGHRALEKANKSMSEVERVEINEAFSSVALNSTRMLMQTRRS